MARSSAASIEMASPHRWIDQPLSPESAASVRAGAIAVLYRGVRYLPVVEDGTLVGILPVVELHAVPEAAADRTTVSCRKRRSARP